MKVDPNTAAALVSAIAAVAASWFAFRSAQTSRHANRLLERDQSARAPNVDVYMIRGSIHRFRMQDLRVYDLHLRVTNRAETPVSIIELLLEIEYTRDQESMPALQVRADPDAAALLSAPSAPPLRAPLRLDGKESREGSAIFQVAMELLRHVNVERYRIIAVDTNSRRWDVTSIGLNEQEHA
jgi:hypothetical protein